MCKSGNYYNNIYANQISEKVTRDNKRGYMIAH